MENKILTTEQIIADIENAPEELQTSIAKAFIRQDIPNEQIQYSFEDKDEFLEACILDSEIQIEEIKEASNEDGIGATYSPRLSAPSTSDLNWIHVNNGGYNYCIKISGNSCLPNCVGYAWGRWREFLGSYHNLSRSNAEMWYLNTGDGYSRGQTPKLGAVMCWAKGVAGNAADGAGHVAIVEKINSDGSITCSNSAYGGTRFYTLTLKAPYNVGTGYSFQGFIYPPINFDSGNQPTPSTPSAPSKSISEIATEVRAGKWGNMPERKTKLEAAGYNYNEIQAEVNRQIAASQPAPTPAPSPSIGLNVGDTVKIIGTGNGSSMGTSNTAYGIGWTRQILRVWDGRPYPYQVGNGSGTTGFYAASALQKQ